MNNTPSLLLRLFFGAVLLLLTLSAYCWLRPDTAVYDIRVINSLWISAAGYVLAAVSINKLFSFPGRQSLLHILPTVVLSYGGIVAVCAALFLRFSNSFVLSHAVISLIFFSADFWFNSRHTPLMGFIPTGRAAEAEHIPHAQWLRLDTPELPENVQAVVADLHSPDLDAAWQKFLAECSLRGVHVYNIRQVEESLTGRVKIRHLYENDLGSLLPRPGYMLMKRILDTSLVLASLPLTLPLMLITALAVRLDSPGKVLFIQNRVGQGGREFSIYKFRSMKSGADSNGARLASVSDQRITRVGRFIRKTRLDELPQLFNVLIGDMSLIGPRPEQKALMEEFERNIPFYGYRHIVKPGLSGWAQVTQGYAGNTDETQIKIEHDFYYIKHLSFSLDLLILLKTLKTVVSGFGAR